jgi:hypothetical protein
MHTLLKTTETPGKHVEEKQLLDGISLFSNTALGNSGLHTILCCNIIIYLSCQQ